MTATEYVGAIDQGTTGTRFVMFDRSGTPITDAFSRLARQTTDPDRVEYDPVEMWQTTTDAAQRAFTSANLDADDLAALAVANQRQTSIVWDRETGDPLHNAISWQDRRTADRVEALSRETVATIRDRTGLEPDPYFAASKLEWLLDHAGGGDGRLRERARDGEVLFGTVDAWLVYNLTGEHVTDVTNAAQTMLFDVDKLSWVDELLKAFRVPREMLPEVRPSSDPDGFGRTDPDGALGAAVPVTGVLGDQQAALVGQAGFDVGDAKVTYGAGNFFLQNVGPDPDLVDGGLLRTVWFQRADGVPLYALEGPLFATGTTLEWLEDLDLLRGVGQLGALARTVDSTDGVFAVPAFSGLGAPDWDASIRGTVVGLTTETKAVHLVRAVLESIAFATRAIADAAASATGVEQGTLLVDGGAMYDDDFCQLQADLLGRRLDRPDVTQTTARGAAFAAGLAIGLWDGTDELRELRSTEQRFRPRAPPNAVEDRYQSWCDVVEGVRDLYERLR